ncbi:putative FAD-linked oxidoreductase [Methyloligella halotolerans]|uniref:Putative FAD-linked oxidoreductase n=1 Tax=Methyloligella halotolerans TaxID=1177755 RepID=A0A1E2RY77_9HYPH|nr:FAD-linked oxidase C-terminal domain-containing protein [Methyloligella halotolerans]ODA67183.1 putative FAD-linked oxidoreductase [Methyloligella halotolerans]
MAHPAILQPDPAVMSRRDEILKQLKKRVPDTVFITDEEGRRTFETDALTAYRCMPLAVALPGSTEAVSAIMAYCWENDIKVVARGAGTSLSGGALPSEDSIVVCISRMNRMLKIDEDNRVAQVESGITNLAISQAVAPRGFFYAPDPSSQLACTLAGNIAMNSGGAHCLKYGVTVNNILGLKLVLVNGEVIELGGDYLDQPGYDLMGLMVGSEGQLAIVTEATVRIIKMPEIARPMLLGFPSSEAAGACVAAIIGAGIVPVAIEFMDKPAIHVCENFANAGYPLDVEAILIVEVEGSEEEVALLLERIAEIAEDHELQHKRISQSAEESAAIWKGRKSAFGAIGQLSDYFCMDGVIPLSRLPEALLRVAELCRAYGFDVANIFHAGDGNLHPLILYNANEEDELARAEACGAEILKVCVELGGCLTGEHGVGIEKRDLMPFQYTEADLVQMMRVKSVFDPDWQLNPAKVFPLSARELL